MRTSRTCEIEARPGPSSESPRSVFTRTPAASHARTISRTARAGSAASEITTRSISCARSTRGRSASAPSTRTPSISRPVSLGSSSRMPAGRRVSPPAEPRRRSCIRCTPAGPAPITSARSARSRVAPSAPSRTRRQPSRAPPSATSSQSHTSGIKLGGNGSARGSRKSHEAASTPAERVTPRNTWNSEAVPA